MLDDQLNRAEHQAHLLEPLRDARDALGRVLVERLEVDHEPEQLAREVTHAGTRVPVLRVEPVVREAQVTAQRAHLDDPLGVLLVHLLEHVRQPALHQPACVPVQLAEREQPRKVLQPRERHAAELLRRMQVQVEGIVRGLQPRPVRLRGRRGVHARPRRHRRERGGRRLLGLSLGKAQQRVALDAHLEGSHLCWS